MEEITGELSGWCTPVVDMPIEAAQVERPAWGSDAIAATLRQLGVPFIAVNPGASFRGRHDSVVNFTAGQLRGSRSVMRRRSSLRET